MKGVAAMSVFLGQLPPAELARLKAELAETLIANFCYPRFFDHRTNSLRMRPVDRAKRQEVWLYLSSIDFTAWNRVDLMSADFQRHIERLIFNFLKRNRSFFGQQGRKRMSDVRMLISSSGLLVTEGMRGHLMRRQPGNPPFGSPRPSISWSTTNGSGWHEQNWEQIASSTMLLQQQLQEVRGEIKATSAPVNEVYASVASTPRHTKQARNGENGHSNIGIEHEVPLTPVEQISNGKPTPDTKSGRPLGLPGMAIAASASSAAAPSKPGTDAVVPPVETPTSPTLVFGRPAETAPATSPVREQAQPLTIPATPTDQPWGRAQPLHPPQIPLQKPPPTPVTGATASLTRSAPPAVNEDVLIFERMYFQLILWLRIEAVRLGKDITSQTPLQLLELLRQQKSIDERHLQVVSTLLNLSNQVIKNGQASLSDYKQGLIFYMMHTQQ
jgi:hypothetical protein